MEKDLSGHVALVTGGRRGIGAAIARRLAAQGAAVVLAAQRGDDEGLAETLALIRSAGGKAEALAFDLGNPQARVGAVERAGAFFGAVDILVNNAAANNYAPPSAMDLAYRRLMFEINVHGPVDLMQQALPAIRAAGWGRILNISRETARRAPIPYVGAAKFIHALTAYGASKIALERYGQALAAELHGRGVHVSAMMPYRIAMSESAEGIGRAMGARHPDWVEGVERWRRRPLF